MKRGQVASGGITMIRRERFMVENEMHCLTVVRGVVYLLAIFDSTDRRL